MLDSTAGKRIVIFGIGDSARLAHFYFTQDSPYEVVAFTVDAKYAHQPEFMGLPLVAFEEVEQHYSPDQFSLFVAVGYSKVNQLRAEKYGQAKQKGYLLVSYLSSRMTNWAKQIGDNCFILEDNTLQPFVKIGNNVVLWSGNHIGHDTTIGDHCFIASHVVISGHVVVEPYCFIGVNATLRNDIRIGAHSVIGAGAVILKDTDEKGVYAVKTTVKHPLSSDRLPRI
jgi:sugar O-acyltransferase (sialic acid O-acetyltransferase NeuD family)